ncbi:MAG: hypothetical protein JEY79_10230 [Pseudodesulfovibrio sp.]|nr:hypothetical protein [Pseudodesulfovibrio sp.]
MCQIVGGCLTHLSNVALRDPGKGIPILMESNVVFIRVATWNNMYCEDVDCEFSILFVQVSKYYTDPSFDADIVNAKKQVVLRAVIDG